jgi:hypothetical protein
MTPPKPNILSAILNSLALTILISLVLGGCATGQSGMSGAELKEAAIIYLEKPSTKSTIKSAIVITGSQILASQVKSDAERTKIANGMYGASSVFYSLMTGEIVEQDAFNKALDLGAPELKQYPAIRSVFQLGWGLILPKVKLSGDANLGLDYLQLMAEAAQEVAFPYISK